MNRDVSLLALFKLLFGSVPTVNGRPPPKSVSTYDGSSLKKKKSSDASAKPGDDGYSSCWVTNRGFHSGMSKCLLRLAANFEIDNRIVPRDKLISSDTVLNELGHALARSGWPRRTFEEIRKELLRLHGRWEKRGRHLTFGAEHTFLWTADSEDEDDIFMPSTRGKSTASSKGKRSASSKGKRSASSKDDDDDFM